MPPSIVTPIMITMPVVMPFLFIAFVIKAAVMEIRPVFPFEPAVVMCIIPAIPVMSVPCGISVVRIPRIIPFVDYCDRRPDPNLGIYMDLCLCRTECQAAGYDHRKE